MTPEETFEQIKAAFSPFGVTALSLTKSGVGSRAKNHVHVVLPQVTIGQRMFDGLVLTLGANSSGTVTHFRVRQFADSYYDSGYDNLHPHIHESGSTFCFGGNEGILDHLIHEGQWESFAATLLSVVSALDVTGGPYRIPSHTLQCAQCGEWNRDGGSNRCERCGAGVCSLCVEPGRCAFCRTTHRVCDGCLSDWTSVTIEGRSDVLFACGTCSRYLQRDSDRSPAICPSCLRINTRQLQCAGCETIYCSSCASFYTCESPFHRPPDDVEEFIKARLEGRRPIYHHNQLEHQGGDGHCQMCVSMASYTIRHRHDAQYVCYDHNYNSPGMKECSNEDCAFGYLPLEYFHRSGGDNTRGECKFCRSERRKLRRQTNEQDNNEATGSSSVPAFTVTSGSIDHEQLREQIREEARRRQRELIDVFNASEVP